MPESTQHQAAKDLLRSKVREWYGAGLSEYPSSGRELDVYTVTTDGVSLMIEVIWNSSQAHYLDDINLVQMSDSQVKMVVANPEIINNNGQRRTYDKVVVAQRRNGVKICTNMFDALQVVQNPSYSETIKRDLDSQIEAVRSSRSSSSAALVIDSVNFLKEVEDLYYVTAHVTCTGTTIVRRLRATIAFENDDQQGPRVQFISIDQSGNSQQFSTGAIPNIWAQHGVNYATSEWRELRTGESVTAIFPNIIREGVSFVGPQQTDDYWTRELFRLPSLGSYTVRVGISGDARGETVLAERTSTYEKI